jgi:diacylglycerol O-acyltransferase/trehalose O-mycolyltransferase
MAVRRGIATLIAAIVVPVVAAPANAAEIVTWQTTSHFVDPSKAQSGYNHPGAPPRPNALRVNVYLPDGYHAGATHRYPVLFLLHGVGDAFDSWALPGQGEVMTTASGFPGFIVMPEADRGFHTNWWNGGRRGDPGWERYHLDELIALVEKHLPIRPERRWHAIFGFSMGGMGAMFYASQRPDYFGSAGSSQGILSLQRPEFQTQPAFGAFIEQDPEAIFGSPTAQEFYWAGHNPLRVLENLRHTRLYVAVGNGVPESQSEIGTGQLSELELFAQAEDFVAAARAAGEEVTYRPQQGTHDWKYRRRHLTDAIQNWGLFAPVSEQPSTWTYKTVAQSGQMWDLRFNFLHPPNELDTFVREGHMLSGTGAGMVAIRTAAGCLITVTLPFQIKLPASCAASVVQPRIELTVRPNAVRVGQLRHFRFTATTVRGGKREPVAAATIHFAGRRALTGATGRVTIARRFTKRGRYKARASKHGLRGGSTWVSVAARPRARA